MQARIRKLVQIFRFICTPEDTTTVTLPGMDALPDGVRSDWLGGIKVILLILAALAVAIQLARVCI